MNIKTQFVSLNEEAKITPKKLQENAKNAPKIENQQNIETVFTVKSKQFKFDCGVAIGGMNIDTGNMFGLKWHKENTNSFEAFLDSIQSYLNTIDAKLTDSDKTRLAVQYNKK